MSPLKHWARVGFSYTDDLMRQSALALNDYIGHAGGLERLKPGDNRYGQRYLKPRHVRVRALKSDAKGRKGYKNIPVNVTSPLWQAPLGQVIVIHDDEYETIERVPEKEYGRKKMLKAMKEAQAARQQAEASGSINDE